MPHDARAAAGSTAALVLVLQLLCHLQAAAAQSEGMFICELVYERYLSSVHELCIAVDGL